MCSATPLLTFAFLYPQTEGFRLQREMKAYLAAVKGQLEWHMHTHTRAQGCDNTLSLPEKASMAHILALVVHRLCLM